LLALVVAILVPSVPSTATAATSSADRGTEQPNVVLIQTDDQTARQFKGRVMPKTTRLLARPGTRFSDYIATTPQCCPSRASLLTGQYAHNHGVLTNGRGYAGLVGKDNVLPVWLQQAGYNTIHVGKFLNGYFRFADRPADVAPGWTDWRTVTGGRFGYYEYFLSKNGVFQHYGKHKRDYITRVLTRVTLGAIKTYAPREAPFYLQLDQHAPHGAGGRQENRCSGRGIRVAKPDPLDIGAFRNARLPHPPSFNERRLGDKPAFLRHAPLLDRERKDKVTLHWSCALASLVGVDRSVAAVYHAVKRAGELDNTVFIYISDNGLFHGEHRISSGKVLPYEEAIRLPLVIKMPGGNQGVRRVDEPVANIDLAPTILDLAHASPCQPGGACRTMDGRSLMPLVTNSGQWPSDRGLLTEYQATSSGRYQICRYAGIRTSSSIYVEYRSVVGKHRRTCHDTFQVERYDLKRDPFELQNLCRGGAIARCPTDAEQDGLEQRLQQLSRCAGIAGRDEKVDGQPFCE
jgi:N-acetylglucosamine-6-sulfatase